MTVLLDANTLYPAPIRDILLSMADRKLFQLKWSDEINNGSLYKYSFDLLFPFLKPVQVCLEIILSNLFLDHFLYK